MRWLILIICLLPSCSALTERRRIREALTDHYRSQRQFERLYAPQLGEFRRLSKP